MIDTFFGANLVDYNTIRIAIFSEVNKEDTSPFNLIINSDQIVKLDIIKQHYLNGLVLYECKTKEKIILGNSYQIACRNFGVCPLNVNEATGFPGFDDEFYYDGDDLGASYSHEKTIFKVWAPLASKVSLFIKKNLNDNFKTYKMRRGEKGVYEITLEGDYDGAFYRYSVTNSGQNFITTDPYAKASSANGRDSCVIDFNKTKIELYNDVPRTIDNNDEAIIYEFHVRDFTIDSTTDIENKGKFLGLTEENRKTKGGNPCGLDYLKYLGITHAQLLPIYDYKTVDELNPDKSYNWGYDPQQYFVPEGSYSLNPNDPYSRIIELKKMVAALHKNGIKINMDVVFNHVYSYEVSTFEKIVPNYYFRKNKNGTLCNGSGCGNDLDSERKMVRKLIIDSLVYWMKEFGIDGYRFDLMGLIDIDTMLLAEKKCKEIKKDAMIYGEGWDMNTNLPGSKKCTIYNSFKTPGIAFFNDTFRDVVRGNNDIKNNSYPGYLLGNVSFLEGFKFCFLGSSVSYCYEPRFSSINQSVNYLECHDNCTLFDKISREKEGASEEEKLHILDLCNFGVFAALGIPFIHAGQEIGLSKKMRDNTYNAGDEFNKFDYSILDKRFEHAMYLKSLIEGRKANSPKFFKFKKSEVLSKSNEFINLNNGAFGVQLSLDSTYKFFVAINPTNTVVPISLNSYYLLDVSGSGHLNNSDVYVMNVNLLPYQGNIFVKKEK